jgi:uncharacterized protein (TIGR03083 family)
MPPAIGALLTALRASHRQLAGIASQLDGAALTAGSYCRDWNRAQVLSHLGSGAEISLGGLRAGLDGTPEPSRDEIWPRWNALPPEAMASGFVEADDRFLAAVEALDPDRRDSLQVPFFLGPTPLAGVLTFRLFEHTLHNWDIRVTLDPHATLLPEAVALLLDLPPVMIRWAARPADATLPVPSELTVTTTDPHRRYLLTVAADRADLQADTAAANPTGGLTLSAEAFLRLASGRLDADHTPPGTQLDGQLTLTDLRTLFPGY